MSNSIKRIIQKYILTAALINVVNPYPVFVLADDNSHFAPRTDPKQYNGPMCRRAPKLPQYEIPKEIQQNTNRGSVATLDAPISPSVDYRPDIPPPPPPPPPPPEPISEIPAPAPPIMAEGAKVARSVSKSDEIMVTGARLKTSSEAKDREGTSNIKIEAGQLTAGDHDDLLNPSLYAKYVDGFLASESLKGVPRVDTRKTLSIIVKNQNGVAIPFANVTLTCADGNNLSLKTMADGKAVFFPELDNLGNEVKMVASYGQGAQSQLRTINIRDVRSTQEVRADINVAQINNVKKFDLAIMLDATGSMGDEINYLKAELRSIINEIKKNHNNIDVRIALVVYRDRGDEFLVRTYDFNSDYAIVQSNLAKQYAGGGGDMPEAVEVAMSQTMGLKWRDDAVKSTLFVADAPPHSDDVANAWAATEVAREKRIQIVPVASSGVDDAAQYLMRAMAAVTQSRYIFITDDSGIGNSHAEPSVDCYKVTKLNSLILRVLDGQISGKRIEPKENEIIRSVGDYDNGKCRAAE